MTDKRLERAIADTLGDLAPMQRTATSTTSSCARPGHGSGPPGRSPGGIWT